MAVELKFFRSDSNIPWGFRLSGGADFDTLLTVVKVQEESISENAGLQLGDVIVRINDYATAGLTHTQAHDLIHSAGNEFVFAVRRDFLELDQNEIIDQQANEEVSDILKRAVKEAEEHNFPKKINGGSVNIDLTDDQIAELISGEAEVLTEQNVLGVNFNKVDLSQSTVLQVVNEQATQLEIAMKDKKWSTFLQKPSGPKPLPSRKEPEIPKEPPYRVIIKKQKKRDLEAEIEAIESQLELEVVEIPAAEAESTESIHQTEEEENLEATESEQSVHEESDVEVDENQNTEEQEANEEEECEETSDNVGVANQEENNEDEVAEGSPGIEEQLAQVQQTLAQISQLPTSVQLTLNALAQQLAKIVNENYPGTEPETLEQDTSEENEIVEEMEDMEGALTPVAEEPEEISERDSLDDSSSESEHQNFEEESNEEEIEIDRRLIEEELEQMRLEQEKEVKQERVNQWNNAWPWSDNNKPIYRINFLKYQPPPKNLDYLQRSEVYRLVHDMEPPIKGIATRPGKILAEQDYYE